MYFFETLVRIHHAGEGVPFTGILPAGSEPEPGIEEADKAVESGSIDALASKLSEALRKVILDRFKTVIAKKKHMDESVEAGREYVESYVTFIHYVEKIHQDIFAQPTHGSSAEEKQPVKVHAH